MKRNKHHLITLGLTGVMLFLAIGCKLPAPDKKKSDAKVNHNYIILLDLSDRLIVQQNQPERDKEIIRDLYALFEEKVKKGLYIKSGDQIKVVMAPQLGASIRRDVFEDRLYVNMKSIKTVFRKLKEEERKKKREEDMRLKTEKKQKLLDNNNKQKKVSKTSCK